MDRLSLSGGARWPVRVDIDVTQRCTSRCYFCYSRRYATDSPYKEAEISLEEFETLIAELAQGGTRTIRFTGGGEPLIHPDIRAMIPIPQRYGLRSCLITNADLLDDELSDLMVMHLDHVRISLNAATNTTRQHLHRSQASGIELGHIITQLQHMVQLRHERWQGQHHPLIWTTFLLLPENVNEIEAAAQAMLAVGADSISFRPIYHDLSRQFQPTELQILHEQIQRARALHNPPVFQVFAPKRELHPAAHLPPIKHFSHCLSCSLRTVVEATKQGLLLKLCGLHRGTGGESLGLILAGGSFSEVWHSSHAAAALSRRPARCSNCIDVSMNVTLAGVLNILQNHPEAIFRKGWRR